MEKIFVDSYNSANQPFSFENFQCTVKHLPIKRLFDITFSSIVLLLLAPFYLLIALLIWISSPGKIFYSHERIGRGGIPFRCYKFRTMYADADCRLKDILKSNPLMHQEWEQTQKLQNDPRVTSIGKILRKFSLDELPQFWNVLKGDLSVVGPRPVLQIEVDKHFGSKAVKILSVRPGITGIWQVSGRSNTTYAERIVLDERYIDEHDLFFDLLLIAKTIPAIVFSRGAY